MLIYYCYYNNVWIEVHRKICRFVPVQIRFSAENRIVKTRIFSKQKLLLIFPNNNYICTSEHKPIYFKMMIIFGNLLGMNAFRHLLLEEKALLNKIRLSFSLFIKESN